MFLWFNGILNHIFQNSEQKQNVSEIQVLCSSIERGHEPVNIFFENNHFYQTGPDKKDQFIGIKFFKIKIRPTAVCIRSAKGIRENSIYPLRAFIIVGRNEIETEIIQEFEYTESLRAGKEEIFFVNTEKYFDHIYVQQTGCSFCNPPQRIFAISKLEIHGLIELK